MLRKRDFSVIKNSFKKRYRPDKRTIPLNLQKALWQSEMVSGLRELLRYEDKNSMAFSLETRTPFVDYRLVELVFSLPACYKIHDGWTKYLLRESTKEILPESIRLRKDKLGFPAPERIWMNNGKQKIISIFSNKDFRAGDYIEPAKFLNNLDSMLRSPSSGTFTPVWTFINLELWLQRMFN
jgi:asparagine synthase (glutamine-hydrolysing)